MKGYIQGIQSDNLGEHLLSVKTHLWFSPISDFIFTANGCTFSFLSQGAVYKGELKTKDEFYYAGMAKTSLGEEASVNFQLFRYKNLCACLGDWDEYGWKYRIIIEVY